MAARITKRLSDEWKEKIQVSQLLNRLGDCASGNVEMTSQQIKAAEILLKKVMPDLKSVDMAGEINGSLAINTITRRIINDRTND